MANELAVGYPSGKNVYSLLRSQTDSKIWDVGDATMEAVGTWNAARLGECDVVLADKGADLYAADFPSAAPADTYYVFHHEREGASPATDDRMIGRQTIVWTGSATTTTTPAAGSGMTLSDLKDICKYHGWHETHTEGEAALTRFINNTLNMLSVLAPWPEYHKRDGTITIATDDEDYLLSETNISKIGDIIRPDRSTPLILMTGGIDEWMRKTKITSSAITGAPTHYACRKYVASGLIRMEVLVWPKPTSSENGDTYYYPYHQLPAILDLATDETDWPNYRMWLLEEALDIRLSSSKKDIAGVSLQTPEFMALVNRAIADSRTSYMPIQAKPFELVKPGKWPLSQMEKTFS